MSLFKRWSRATPPPDQTPTASGETAALPDAPLAMASSQAAREAHKANPFTTWAARAFAANQADASLACHRLWAERPEMGVSPKFKISRHEPVFAMGSCFAREVEDALLALGFDVPTHCDALFEHPLLSSGKALSPGARPRSYLNRYNSMSMLDEFRHLLGLAPDIEQGLLSYAIDPRSSADLHYSQSLPQVNAAQTLERRALVRAHLGPELRRSRVFVLTLGLGECWYDGQAKRYLNNTPGPRVQAAFGEQLSVHQTRFVQHLTALQQLHAVLGQAFGADFKVVVTVSPVPLERTFLPQDVIVSNTYAKSMLRAVAQEFAASFENVDYFPSYELVSYAQPKTAWAWDHRHVTPGLVAHVMSLFQRHYVEETAPSV